MLRLYLIFVSRCISWLILLLATVLYIFALKALEKHCLLESKFIFALVCGQRLCLAAWEFPRGLSGTGESVGVARRRHRYLLNSSIIPENTHRLAQAQQVSEKNIYLANRSMFTATSAEQTLDAIAVFLKIPTLV
ncbi:hypothetical protein [Nostoc sp.]|uniref:hypothetical protein n=1 Tax=Nostoc sp. TaxID=1180 RepID=UPI002FF70022